MSFMINPFVSGGGGGGGGSGNAVSSLSNGFTGLKVTASGSVPGTIAGWDASHWDPSNEFNETTGIWTVGETGLYFIGSGGFGQGGTGSGTEGQIARQESLSNLAGATSRDYADNGAHADSNFAGLLVKATAAEEYNLRQQGDTMERCWFSAAPLTSSVAFSANKGASSGSANTTIGGWTEIFDDGNNFNPTTGIYTAPADGYYVFFAHGFASAGTTNTAGVAYEIDGSIDYQLDHDHGGMALGNSLGSGIILNLTAGQEVSIRQVNAAMEICRFAGVQLDPATIFAARKSAATGAGGDTIDGWTEDFDRGGDFNASTGEFTAPATGQYLVLASGYAQMTDGVEWNIRLKIDSTELLRARHFSDSPSGGTHDFFNRIGVVVDLTVGEKLTLTQNGIAASRLFFGVIGLY